jgi:hypothetical protein
MGPKPLNKKGLPINHTVNQTINLANHNTMLHIQIKILSFF